MSTLKYQNISGSILVLQEEDKMIPKKFIDLPNTDGEKAGKKIGTIVGIPVFFLLLLCAGIASLSTSSGTAAEPLSKEVEAYRPMVSTYCSKYKIGEYTDLALALMMAESGGSEPDPMQAAMGFYPLNPSGHSVVITLDCCFNPIKVIRTFHLCSF